MVLVLKVQYFEAWVKVKPGQLEYLPAFIVASQVDLTGNPTAAWR